MSTPQDDPEIKHGIHAERTEDQDQDQNRDPTKRKITFEPPNSGPYSSISLYVYSAVMGLVSISSLLLGVSYIYCPDHIIPHIEPICKDDHYRYLVPLLVPVVAWFSIANWVGWEYFRYS